MPEAVHEDALGGDDRDVVIVDVGHGDVARDGFADGAMAYGTVAPLRPSIRRPARASALHRLGLDLAQQLGNVALACP